jgi:hypothetical protein
MPRSIATTGWDQDPHGPPLRPGVSRCGLPRGEAWVLQPTGPRSGDTGMFGSAARPQPARPGGTRPDRGSPSSRCPPSPRTGRNLPPTATVVNSDPDPRTREPEFGDDRNKAGRVTGAMIDLSLGREHLRVLQVPSRCENIAVVRPLETPAARVNSTGRCHEVNEPDQNPPSTRSVTVAICDRCGDINFDDGPCRCRTPYDQTAVPGRHRDALTRAPATATRRQRRSSNPAA